MSTANKNFITLRMLLKGIINLISKWIGIYEIRIRLYLWELFNALEQKKGYFEEGLKMSKRIVVVIIALALFCQPAHAAQQDLYEETVLRTLQLQFSQQDWWSQLEANYQPKENIPATLTVDGVSYEGVGVRFRGITSYMMTGNSQKKSFNIEIDYTIEDQRLMGYKKLNLNNGFSDPTFIRETIGYEMFEQMDIPTPRRAFADVWVNNIHLGLYTIVEQVDKTFLRRNFANPEGNLYKPETPAATLNWTKDDLDKQSTNVSQSSENKKQNNLDIKVGGARLGDLVKVLKREGSPGSQMLPDDTATSAAGPGRPFPGDPNRPFAGDPAGPFLGGPSGHSLKNQTGRSPEVQEDLSLKIRTGRSIIDSEQEVDSLEVRANSLQIQTDHSPVDSEVEVGSLEDLAGVCSEGVEI